MAKMMIRGAAAALCAAAVLAVGCTGGSSISPVNIAGHWVGAFTLTYAGGGATSGTLSMTLDQQNDFASGIATWVPADQARSVAVQVDGSAVTLSMHFTCKETDPTSVTASRNETTVLTGAFSGTTLNFTEASGIACPDGLAGGTVASGSSSLTRTSNTVPL